MFFLGSADGSGLPWVMRLLKFIIPVLVAFYGHALADETSSPAGTQDSRGAVQALVAAGTFAEALSAAQALPDTSERNAVTLDVIASWSRTRDYKAVEAAVDSIADRYTRARAMVALLGEIGVRGIRPTDAQFAKAELYVNALRDEDYQKTLAATLKRIKAASAQIK